MRPSLRITGGSARGRRLQVPAGKSVRPSPSKVRSALFNILMSHTDGARCLDLFAGAGSLGLEALSRGAASCLFVEGRAAVHKALESNVDELGFRDAAALLHADAFRSVAAVSRSGEPFDIIFVDPPHRFWLTRKKELIKMLRKLSESGAVAPDAVWVIGHPRGSPEPDALAFLGRLDHRAYGEAHVTIAKR